MISVEIAVFYYVDRLIMWKNSTDFSCPWVRVDKNVHRISVPVTVPIKAMSVVFNQLLFLFSIFNHLKTFM